VRRGEVETASVGFAWIIALEGSLLSDKPEFGISPKSVEEKLLWRKM